ncbi:transcriptional regulator domain-containing protein [Sphingopyxis indica]|uniref:Transcriptional regulator-like domain-containing protein n=1 Tax=Sphingopyxis indica TaxID=436663 RepID=A0A239IKD2_9SPHN|nr:hypothetical protein SAMN06295955_10831 [Sphingopyxis indica]
MPQHGTWRSASAYDYVEELDPEELAWEFLRRNRQYQAEYQQLTGAARLDASADTGICAKWGLRFRDGPEATRDRCRDLLGGSRRSGDTPLRTAIRIPRL